MTEATAPADQGTATAEFVRWHLDNEHTRLDTVNKRAGTAVTGSTGFVTALIAVLAVVKGRDSILSGAAAGFLIAAVFFLIVSAILALVAGWPRKYTAADEATFRTLISAKWSAPETDARSWAVQSSVDSIISLRAVTKTKYRFLSYAYLAQILAAGCAALCAFYAL